MSPKAKTIAKAGLLVLAASVLVAASFTYGVTSVRRKTRPYQLVVYFAQRRAQWLGVAPRKTSVGAWDTAARPGQGPRLAEERKEALGQLEALPYLQGYERAPAVDNVVVHDEQSAYRGLNFIVSADAPNALLIDMKGTVLHRWRKDFSAVWPQGRQGYRASEVYKTYWRRAQLLENGDVLAIFMDFGLIKLDKSSKLLWVYEGGVHHDLFRHANGDIYVLSRELRKRDDLKLESWENKRTIWDDAVTVLSPEGKELRKVSLIDCFLRSEYASLLEHVKNASDVLHANSIKPILVDRPPLFKKGQVLVSMRDIHTLAVVDLEQQKVVWAATGQWKYQHEPWLLDNGNLLLFDNRGNHGASRGLEFDPLTQRIVWSYGGQAGEKFYSREAGAIQRLPNGNTLMTESDRGRGVEVTPDGRVVWEFVNPHRAGEAKELIAALYDVVRLPRENARWLAAGAGAD